MGFSGPNSIPNYHTRNSLINLDIPIASMSNYPLYLSSLMQPRGTNKFASRVVTNALQSRSSGPIGAQSLSITNEQIRSRHLNAPHLRVLFMLKSPGKVLRRGASEPLGACPESKRRNLRRLERPLTTMRNRLRGFEVLDSSITWTLWSLPKYIDGGDTSAVTRSNWWISLY